MRTAEEVLREYVKFDDVNGNETVELLPLTIVDAMLEFADENVKALDDLIDAIQKDMSVIEKAWSLRDCRDSEIASIYEAQWDRLNTILKSVKL